MKRKLAIITLTACMAVLAAACGKADTSGEPEQEVQQEAAQDAGLRLTTVSAADMDNYITLGDYKGIEVTAAAEEVTDDQVEAMLRADMENNAQEVEDENAVIENGDIANINYEGTKDGVAFDGGTAEDYDLNIGSGTFIEGFEEGLLGAKKGEERDLNLTFPEEYPSEELAGQAVVFHVKVNAIKRPPEMTDDWVKENTSYQTVDEYKEGIRKDYQAQRKESAQIEAKSNAWNQVSEASEIKEYPEADLEKGRQGYQELMEQFAKQQGMTVDELLQTQGMSQEDFDAEKEEYAKTMVKQNLIVQAILDKEGITFESEAGQQALEAFLQEQGGLTLEELKEQYGEQAVNEAWGVMIAGDFIMENAKVTESLVTSDGKDGYDADADMELEIE